MFDRLVDAGHTLVLIEHNLDVIKLADWVIDLGPEAGDRGGEIVATGGPKISRDRRSVAHRPLAAHRAPGVCGIHSLVAAPGRQYATSCRRRFKWMLRLRLASCSAVDFGVVFTTFIGLIRPSTDPR